jgi:hypothetical protein
VANKIKDMIKLKKDEPRRQLLQQAARKGIKNINTAIIILKS